MHSLFPTKCWEVPNSKTGVSVTRQKNWYASKLKKQECSPVGCIPPAAVVAIGGRVPQPPLGTMHPPGTMQPPLGPCTPRYHALPPGPCTPCGQTHACKHITLPQTSFAGGKKIEAFALTCSGDVKISAACWVHLPVPVTPFGI